eukprot:COSAG02_NODE_25832_length_647_cov_2.063869_2_plen_76_part_00
MCLILILILSHLRITGTKEFFSDLSTAGRQPAAVSRQPQENAQLAESGQLSISNKSRPRLVSIYWNTIEQAMLLV